MISETVLIAALTTLAGLGGAAIGAYASIRIARDQNRMHLNRCVLEGTFQARRNAYQRVFDAENEFAAHRTEGTAMRLLRTVKEACVVASPYTAARMMMLIEAATSERYMDFDGIRADMLVAMQKDLVTFMEPKIAKYSWSDSTAKANCKDEGENAGKPE